MSIVRRFVIGLCSGLALLLSLGGKPVPALVLAPLALVVVVALFGSGPAGWGRRLGRGAVGATLAGAAGFAAAMYLKGRTDWFDWHDEQGGHLWLMLIVAFAAVPGAVAALAARPGHGLALAGGFACGIAAPFVAREPLNPGFIILLAIGTAVGTLVCALGRRYA